MEKQFLFGSMRPVGIFAKNRSGLFTLLFLLTAIFSLQAADVRVYTFDSQGNPVAGQYKVQLGPNFIGTFNSGDTADLNVGATYKIWAIYNNTSTERLMHTVNASGDSLAFSTTNVKFHFSGNYLDFRSTNSWSSFGAKVGGEWPARELFPHDYNGNLMKIQTGYKWNDTRTVIFEIDYRGLTNVEKTLSVIRVLDSDGNPTFGATARGGYASPTLWHVPGSTDSTGLLMDMRNGKQTSLSYEAKVNNTTAVEGPKDPTTDSYYLFQTDAVVLRLQSCDGTGLAGGKPRFGHGSSYTTTYFPNNPGMSTNTSGNVSGQMFPGTYSFEMQYKHTSDRKISVNIPAGGATLTWNTVTVNLNYSGTISYGGSSGDVDYFNQPTMELLPGTYTFHFRGAGREDLTLSGCNYSKSAVLVDVLDCNGKNQPGVDVQWYKYGNANNKHAAGTTGSSTFPVLVDSSVTQVGIVVDYLGQTNTLVQNINSNGTFTFQMLDVEVVLYNHDSTAALVPQDIQFYVYGNANNKMAFPSSQNKCLLPGQYGFVVKYNETDQNRNQINVSVENPVFFQTGLVEDLAGCSFTPTTYYAYGDANNPHTFNNPMEFMPSKVGVKSSVNPTKLIQVQSAAVHRLDTCADVAVMDSCVSDSGWTMSTVVTPSNYSGWWGGVTELPHDSTYTLAAEVGQPFPWGGISVLPGTLPIKAGHSIRYYKKNFGLAKTAGLEARFRMYMDDATEIYINGHLISREENVNRNNSRGVPHDLLLKADKTNENGYLGGDSFDHVASVDLDTILNADMNTLVLVIRNLGKASNIGAFSFRMDITKDGESVLVAKKANAGLNNLLLTAYPNPVNDVLNIEPEQVVSGRDKVVRVYNLSGQLVIEKTFTDNEAVYQINMAKLNSGVYLVRFTSGDAMQYAKVIKK